MITVIDLDMKCYSELAKGNWFAQYCELALWPLSGDHSDSHL